MTEQINVLYIHHYGVFGGASKSLFEAIRELKSYCVRPYFVMPQGGVADLSSKLGPTIVVKGVSQFSNHELGGYQGFRWLVLLRELFFLPGTLLGLRSAKKKWDQQIDLIHVNEISLLFVGVFAKLIFKKPLILHVRTVQASKARLRSKIIGKLALWHVDRIVAIDGRVAGSLTPGLPVAVIRNGEHLPVFDKQMGKKFSNTVTFGIVANFVEYKGIRDFIDAAILCIRQDPESRLRFLVFGDNYRPQRGLTAKIYRCLGLSRDIKTEIESKIVAEGVADVIKLCGFVEGIKDIYKNIDVLCFPSHLNAVGRPVFEAAVFGRPSIVSLRELADADGIVDGETGMVVPERNPEALSEAMLFLADNLDIRLSMGAAARKLAETSFSIKRNANQLYRLYQDVMHKP